MFDNDTVIGVESLTSFTNNVVRSEGVHVKPDVSIPPCRQLTTLNLINAVSLV